jgi:hypothetical protein
MTFTKQEQELEKNKNKTKQKKGDWFYTCQRIRLDRNIAMRRDFTHNKKFDFVLGYEQDTYLLFY